ncbi:MAG: FHA domain-containing protein [Myxococcota bacterium]
MAHLTLMVQGREVRRFVLNPTVTTIGRAQDNDIVINNLALSRRHAEVHFRQGRFEVEDVGSQNGVFINSERIRGARSLDPNDKITLGTYQFVFCDEASRDPDVRRARARRNHEVTQLESVKEPPPPANDGDPSPLLVLKYNDVELQRFVLRTEPCLIGRGKDCDIQIAERRLSRRHCRVRTDGDRVVLEDLGSQNGTFVNRRRIPDRRDLQHGDILNFAEYSILFLADASEYDGPDGDGPKSLPAAESSIQKAKTDFAEAYESALPSVIPASDPVVASASNDEIRRSRSPQAIVAPSRRADNGDPLVEQPNRARERRTRQPPSDTPALGKPALNKRRRTGPTARNVAERPTRDGDLAPDRVEVRPGKADHIKSIRRRDHRDVDDLQAEIRPDRRLDDWYDKRDDSDIYQEEPSVLLERSKSSMSQLLSTMMVDKRELDRNLAVKAKERRFVVEVSSHGRTSYSGPLMNPVTILGRDDEADIKLTGRYVAGRHSILVRVRDSLLLVRLGSSSAARVNGLPKLQAFLKSGDVIQIDETTIRINEE